MCLEGQILLLSAFSSIIWQFKFHLKRRMCGWHCRFIFKNISDGLLRKMEQLACSWHVLALGSDPPFHPYINPFNTQFLSLISLSLPFCRPVAVTDLRVICFRKIRGFFFLSVLFPLSPALTKNVMTTGRGTRVELSFVSLCGWEATSDPQSCLVFGWKAEGLENYHLQRAHHLLAFLLIIARPRLRHYRGYQPKWIHYHEANTVQERLLRRLMGNEKVFERNCRNVLSLSLSSFTFKVAVEYRRP